MIAYETLCQHISDWREGKKPGLPPPLAGGVATAAAPYQDDAEPMADVDDQDYDAQPEGYEAGIPEYDVSAEADAEYEELDTMLEDESIEGAADDFAEGPVDRTQAYVPEHYDPANVAAQMQRQAAEGIPDAPPAEGVPDMPMADLEQLSADVSYAEPVAAMPDEDMSYEEVDLEDDEDDDDDFERDYDLEEIDDYASFDPYTDLKAFFKAENHIAAVWEDRAQRHATLAQYGIRDEQHFYQVTSSMERYFISDDAESRYGGLDGIMQLKLDATSEAVREEQQARIEGELASDFEPVLGISLQQWAVAQAHVAQGNDVGPLLGELGIDEPTWQAVSAEWNDRMSRDTTATIATEYGKAFASGGVGQFGAAGAAGAAAADAGGDPEGDPPISIEQWVEIEVAQSVGYEQGRDASEILAEFGMTPADWGMAGMWWSQYFSRHAMENGGALHQHYSQLREHYEAHYRGTAE